MAQGFNAPDAGLYLTAAERFRRSEWLKQSVEEERRLNEMLQESMEGYKDPTCKARIDWKAIDALEDKTWWCLDYPDTPEDNLLMNIRGLGNDYKTRMAVRRGVTRNPNESDEEWAARCEALLPSLDYRPYNEGTWLRAKEAMQRHRDVHGSDGGLPTT